MRLAMRLGGLGLSRELAVSMSGCESVVLSSNWDVQRNGRGLRLNPAQP